MSTENLTATMDDYARQRREKREAARVAAQQIADALGNGWALLDDRPDHYDPAFGLAGPDGEVLRLYGYSANARWTIEGSLPQGLYNHKRYNAETGTITVATSRPAAAIAREIERRLLPVYRATLQEARANFARYSQEVAELQAAATEIADILGLHANSGTNDKEKDAAGIVRLGYYHGSPFHGEIAVSHKSEDGTRRVQIKVDYLTVEEAHAVCRILAARPLQG